MARRRSGHVKKIDNLIWDDASANSLVQSAGVVAANYFGVGTLPTTLLRIRGNLLCYVDGTPDPGDLTQMNVGIILVPEGSGTTAQYSPVADGNAPWLYYSSFGVGYEEGVVNILAYSDLAVYREVIDNKAMRRVRPDVEAQIVFESTTIGSAVAVNTLVSTRFLQGF